MLALQSAPLPVMVTLLQRLADTLNDLLKAAQAQNRAQILELEKKSQAIRLELAKAPEINPSDMSYDALNALRTSLGRVRQTEADIAAIADRQAPQVVSTEPDRTATDIEAMFIKVLESPKAHDFSEFLPKAAVIQNSKGRPLYGYDSDNFNKAALHLTAHASRGRYKESMELIENMELALQLEKMRLRFLNLVFPRSLWDKHYAPISDGQERSALSELLIRLYAAESHRDVSDIVNVLEGANERGQALWDRVVPDEDNPTHEQLSAFYNGRNFPEGDCVPGIIKSTIGTAFRLIPVLIAEKYNLTSVFDYGGGAGLSTAALKANGCDRALLIEENRRMLKFAKWRDQEAGIEGVEYVTEGQLCSEIKAHRNRYDFGVCTEVLEHVIDVEETAERMAKLIRPGGYLYQTTSFDLYPHLSHLKPNLRFAGKEDELMAAAGFESVSVELPIPTVNSMRLYKRV